MKLTAIVLSITVALTLYLSFHLIILTLNFLLKSNSTQLKTDKD